MRRDNMLSSRFGPGFRIRLHLKNLMNALDRAKKTGVILPTTAEVERLMQVARVAGREDFDHSGLITVTDDLSHFRVADFAGGADGGCAGRLDGAIGTTPGSEGGAAVRIGLVISRPEALPPAFVFFRGRLDVASSTSS